MLHSSLPYHKHVNVYNSRMSEYCSIFTTLKKKHHGDNFYKATFFMKFRINNKKKIRFSTDDLKGVLCSTRKARVSGFVNFGSR